MPDDNLNYTELETQLQTAPLTWLPGLLYTLVATCVRRRVYQEGGLVIAVMRAQQIAEAEKIRKDGMIQASLATAEATNLMGELGYKVKETTTHVKKLKEQKRYLLNNLITGTIRTPETLSTKLTK